MVDPVTLDDVKPGDTGEIWIRTIQAMRGYLNQTQATVDMKTTDGWLRTGDIGRLDDAGFPYILDRLKDMIITGGEAVTAIVVPAPGVQLTAADVIAFCRERLAHYQCLSSVDFVDDLPRNPTGKVLKRSLREPYWADR